MNSHRLGIFQVSFLLVLASGIPTPAAELPVLDSTAFPYRYEGEDPLLEREDLVSLGAGYFGSLGHARLKSDGKTLHIDTPATAGLMLYNPFWKTDAGDAEGWTWEIRLRVAKQNTQRSFQFRLGDGDGVGASIGLQVWPDRLQSFQGRVLFAHDFSADWVTLRIAQTAGSQEYLFWINGRSRTLDMEGEYLQDGDKHWIGDGSSAAFGKTAVDYLRWTGLGAFAPDKRIPKSPSALEHKAPHRNTPDVDKKAPDTNDYISQRRLLPDFGLLLNDDGDGSFPSADPTKAAAYRRAMIDSFAGTPVKTIMVSVGAGSDTLYYPTQVASVVGWRTTKYDRQIEPATSEEELWGQRITNIKNGMQAGIDPVRLVAEQTRSHDIMFVPSYRMNDDHFMFDPLHYPLTGKFWMDHHERFKIRHSPILSEPRYGQLLDYSHLEVREFRRQTIYEIIDRYGETMHGLELDFNRVQVFFPRHQATARAHLITSLVADIRQRLDQVGQECGRDLFLFVRIPPTLKHCRWSGLNVQNWIERHLVDVLIPAQLMTLAQDMPIDEFVALAQPQGVQVYPALYPRSNWRWAWHGGAPTQYTSRVIRRVTPAMFRGAAANYWHLGAAGFQLFNFRTITVPQPDEDYRVMRDLAHPACLNLANKVFAITPGYYLDYEDTYQAKKQLPRVLHPEKISEFQLFVGEDLSTPTASRPLRVLRIGLRGATPSTTMSVHWNQRALFQQALGAKLVPVTAPIPATAATHYVHLLCDNKIKFRQGNNQLQMQATNADEPLSVVECQLGIFYPPRPQAIFEP